MIVRLNKSVLLFILTTVFISINSPAYATSQHTTNTLANMPKQVAIASAAPQATDAGLAMLKKGGNAFDAAIAVASSLAVVEPYSSGLGGGAFFLLRIAGAHGDDDLPPTIDDNEEIFIDARETAPDNATKDMFFR